MTEPKLRIVPNETPLPPDERPSFFIELGKLHIDWEKNARRKYEDTEGMAAALTTSGQINPLLCVEGKDSEGNLRYELAEGFSRVKAWQKMYPSSWQTHRVEIKVRKILREGDDRLLGLQANVVRHNLRHVDLAREVWDLHRKYGYSVEWLVKHTAISSTKMRSLLKVWGNLCKEVKAAWEKAPEDVLPWTLVQKWAALPDEDAQRLAMKRHMGENKDPEDESEPKPERERQKPYLSDIKKKWRAVSKKERLSERDEGIRDALAWVVGKGDMP
jgi:hypothetical protein